MRKKEAPKNNWIYPAVKRAFDLLLALVGSVVSLPLILLGSIAILAEDPTAGPIFTQERVGKDGKRFIMYKLRTMRGGAEDELKHLLSLNEMDGPAFKIKQDPRITGVGRVLRKTYADELPQLWNVLKGDMSLVGPRPPLPGEVERYSDAQREKLSVQQGITCYWQSARGHYSLPFDRWIAMDLKYVRERGIRTDLKILLLTLGSVLRADGW